MGSLYYTSINIDVKLTKEMYIHIKKAFLIGIMICFFSSCLLAFDPSSANKSLDKITLSLSGKEITLSVLNDASAKINDLKKEADKCIKENSDQLNELKAQLPDIDPSQVETITKEQLHFIEKKSKIESTISDCKLFILRANESLNIFTEQSKQIKKNIILTPRPPMWSQIPEIPALTFSWVQSIQLAELKHLTSIDTYTKNEMTFILILSCFIFIISFLIKRNALILLKNNKEKRTDGELLCDRLLNVFFKRSNSIFLFFILFGYTSIHDLHFDLDYLLNDFLLGVILYLLILGVLEFLIFPFKQGVSIFKVPKKVAKHIMLSSKIYFGFCLLGLVGLSLRGLFKDDLYFSLVAAVYFTGLSISFLSFIYNTILVSSYIHQRNRLKTYFLFTLLTVFSVLIYLRWYGFEGLSSYLLNGVMLTYIGGIVSYLMFKLTSWVIDGFSSGGGTPHMKLFKIFNIQRDEVLLEMIVLKVVVFSLVWGGFLILLNEFWSLSELWSIKVREVALTGFDIANAHIIPIRIVGGLTFFSISILTMKVFKNLFYSRDHLSFNAAEEAYVIIVGYLGYGTILIFAMLIAGVNLQGLAIIAGALSVGIGFGLQGIVNNFVSGLVLLLERPIKRGDRIIVGDKEGFVTDIGIRSTRINTLLQTDVIIPNAELVSSSVVNYMYNNKKTRMIIFAEVEQGSDPLLVKTLLFQAARENPAVIQTGSDEPMVYFNGFTSSSLKFELWCSVENVNFLYQTKSDLYFKINAIFIESKIKIAFQQMDLHIKDASPLQLKFDMPDGINSHNQ